MPKYFVFIAVLFLFPTLSQSLLSDSFEGQRPIIVFTDSFEPWLAVPDNIRIRQAKETSLRIEWDKVSEADYYHIYYATKDFSHYLFDLTDKQLINFAKKNGGGYKISYSTSKELYSLDRAKEYYIVVKAFNDELVSQSSKTLIAATRIAAPTFIQGKSYGMGTVTISWRATPEATAYTVYFSDKPFLFENDGDKHAKKLNNHVITTNGKVFENILDTTINIDKLDISKTYYFVVTASQNKIESYADKSHHVVIRGGLNDTGVTTAEISNLNNNPNCLQNKLGWQDCYYGRDKTHNDNTNGVAGFDFVKLDENGKELLSHASNWSCVLDKTTGLIWEVKNSYSKNKTYAYYDERFAGENDLSDNATSGGEDGVWAGVNSSYGTTARYISYINNQKRCGFDRWRLPTREELRSLVYYGQKEKDGNGNLVMIDLDYFPNTQNNDYWTSTPVSGHHRNNWVVYFGNGMTTERDKATQRRIRLVYGDQ